MRANDERRSYFRHGKVVLMRYVTREDIFGRGYVETKDISRGGLRFSNDRALQVGVGLELEIYLESATITVNDARVTWTEKVPDADEYLIGLEFPELPLSEYRKIVEHAAK